MRGGMATTTPRGMSRKVLAQTSGISERYIAQLEAGMGNVSIVLLRRLAKATGVALDDFVSEAPVDFALLRDLLRGASPEAIERAKAALRGEGGARAEPREAGADRIALIGLRGAGKSTLGRLAAEKLGWRFVELNKEIELSSGFSVTEIFRLYGQEGYRRLELRALREIAERHEPMILATGGGIVAEPVTFELLLSSFFTIWVKAAPHEHMARVRKQGDLRPMANDRAAMEELVTILSSREPLYGRARAVIDTSGRTAEASLADLMALIATSRETVPVPLRPSP
jgi:XRE family aerobic/anaerobic benzoate catabolism transcriptional regulator